MDTKDRDLLFCEVLFTEGSVVKASERLGIAVSTGRSILNKNKHIMADLAAGELAALAFKAVSTIKETLENPESPKQEVALKAAESVLDRLGASKRTATDIEVTHKQPVILLPAKDTVVQTTVDVYVEASD